MNQLALIAAPALPTLVAAAGDRARTRFLEFFAANIRNPHTRRAYARAAEEFLGWCASAGARSIADVQPVHVATWIETGTRELAAPSVKQRLAAIRHLFDWLVTGQVVPINPAGSVRGPRHVVTCGQTPVLDPAEARALLDSIDTGKVVGLRDRALIGLMVYSFARIGAALGMAVEDVYTQNRRLWCGCARRAASATRCRATTTLMNISSPISTGQACATIPRGRYSARSGAVPASSRARCCRRRTPMR
jgi:site-specific recombinase XerC